MKKFIFMSVMLMLSNGAYAKVVGEEVTYSDGKTEMKGYIAYDNKIKGERPGVIVVHEWWGHNGYARKRADMLAKLGYTAFAIDMYGDGKTASHPEDAGRFSGEVRKNMPEAEARFRAAYELLQKHKSTRDSDISAIGYCFGGGIVLEMARRGLDLDAVVSFHGSLGTESPAEKGKVKAKLLVLNGEADQFIKPESIAAFKKEMDDAGVNYRFINYPGAVHSFTSKEADARGKEFNLPLAYNKDADKKSWAEMKKLFKKVYKK